MTTTSQHMRAVRFHKHGGPEGLQVDRVPIPAPSPGQVLIRVKACALNHLDLWIRKGIPAYKVPLPHIPGSDVAGVVAAIGEAPASTRYSTLEVGQPVIVSPGLSCWACEWCLGGKDHWCPSLKILGAQTDGGYAEYVTVPDVNVFPVPDGLTFEQAAALPLVSLTAWHMVFGLADLRPGETALVVGAGSGVGSLAVQLAKLAGATVFTTVGTPSKAEKAKTLGADFIINHSQDDITKTVLEKTQGRGVDVVIEHIGQQVWESCLRSLARGGRLVTCGATTGGDLTVNVRYLFSRQLRILGSYLGARSELLKVLALVEAGKVRPIVDRVFPLEEARAAQEYLSARKAFGKVVLSVG